MEDGNEPELAAIMRPSRVVLAASERDVFVVDLVQADGMPFSLVLRRPETAALDASIEHVLAGWADASTPVIVERRIGPRGPVAVVERPGAARTSIRLDLVA